MSYTVSLHAEERLSDIVKLRTDLESEALISVTQVNNGNFTNKNLFCDNTFEIGSGNEIANAYQNACASNVIRISWDKYIVIGFITDWEYINDNNVKISYRVDSYMSAFLSKLITKADGLCERISMTTNNEYFANEQAEPFSPSDNSWADPLLTEEFNASIHQFEGISPGSSGVNTSGTCFVMTVSPKVKEWLGVSEPFSIPPVPVPELKNIDNFRFIGSDSSTHCGGVFRGFPLKFTTWTDVQQFVKDILSGCGFRTTLPSSGFSTQESVIRRALVNFPDTPSGSTHYSHKNWNNDPYESITYIGGNDLYNLYCIPEKFAVANDDFITGYARAANFPNLDDMHSFGSESNRAGKLLAYPYIYSKLVTANGDTVTIIPQIHYGKSSEFAPDFTVQMSLRFVGGDTPKIMGRIVPGFAQSGLDPDAYGDPSVCEWFTIRNYPAITLSFNDVYNPQVQRDITSSRKLMIDYMNSVASARLTSALVQGYRDRVDGSPESGINQNMGVLSSIGYGIGSLGGAAQNWVGDKLGIKLGSALTDTTRQNAMNAARLDRYGNIINAEQGVVMGNDFLSQYGIPAIACYISGGTDAELFSFCRYLEEFGTAYNGRVDPVTRNFYALLGGYGDILPFNGRVFYKFSNITIEGAMPQPWRDNIKQLFESGVYIIDN